MNASLHGKANPQDVDTGLRHDGIRKSEKCAAADTALQKAASNLNNYKILPEQDIMGRTAILQRAHIWALKRYVGVTRRGV